MEDSEREEMEIEPGTPRLCGMHCNYSAIGTPT